MNSKPFKLLTVLLAAVATGVQCGVSFAGETATIDAFSVWQAEARIFKSGASRGTVVGLLRGPMFVETPEGPTRTGTMVCPVIVFVGDAGMVSKDNLRAFARRRWLFESLDLHGRESDIQSRELRLGYGRPVTGNVAQDVGPADGKTDRI